MKKVNVRNSQEWDANGGAYRERIREQAAHLGGGPAPRALWTTPVDSILEVTRETARERADADFAAARNR